MDDPRLRRDKFHPGRRNQGDGGISFSSGNSIPDYVPTEGHLVKSLPYRVSSGKQIQLPKIQRPLPNA